MQYDDDDDRVVSTPHIRLVPCKEYRWGGLQWHFIYVDFHKHHFINVCSVSVLCTYRVAHEMSYH